jgi:hypothetical protein
MRKCDGDGVVIVIVTTCERFFYGTDRENEKCERRRV